MDYSSGGIGEKKEAYQRLLKETQKLAGAKIGAVAQTVQRYAKLPLRVSLNEIVG
ncbi:hypothetical protein GCM10011383_27360 [Hymenobacter cavernae]|uniref:Uncharacterized protein n=1 Tax=Hymenobacter cavernae TaxID=2044852 RepID=A0ABQ1UEZ8_9BACT|nr:hypothetical protein GCM10011383_27360 [Hymenobacter cavernae]